MKMSKRIVGEKTFPDTIDITDPCYDRDVWCRVNGVKIVPGNYTCIAWIYNDTFEWNGKMQNVRYVGSCGIYLNGIIPSQKDYEEIGEIGVDAGLAGFFIDKPDYTDSEWHDFCDRIKKGNAWIFDEGFFTSSGHGDGGYPVYAAKDKEGNIVSLEIRFI